MKKRHTEELKRTRIVLEGLQERIKKDYYKPRKIKTGFDDKYIEYESRGDKNKNFSQEDYLDIINPFLRDMINNHKSRGEWKI